MINLHPVLEPDAELAELRESKSKSKTKPKPKPIDYALPFKIVPAADNASRDIRVDAVPVALPFVT